MTFTRGGLVVPTYKTGRQTTCRRSPPHELAFANQVHELDASQDRLRRPKRFEAEHRPGKAFDCAVILLHDVVRYLICRIAIGIFRSLS
jgi:hypothetical protein